MGWVTNVPIKINAMLSKETESKNIAIGITITPLPIV